MDELTPATKQDDGGGAPMWMVTFADLATLLMCFFVLILSFSEMDLVKYKQLAGSMREAFGLQREVKTKDPPRGVNVIAKEFSAGRPEPTMLNRVRQHTVDHLKYYLDVREPKNLGGADQITSALKKFDDRGGDQPPARMEQIEAALQEEMEQGLIEIGSEDKKLVIRIQEKGSFPSGGADMMHQFKPILAKIAAVLEYTPGAVTVAGHSDDIPIKTTHYRSNWELSAARSVSVVHELLKHGKLDPKRFQVAGFADTRPIAQNATAKGRAQNRRVELMIVRGDDREGATLPTSRPAAPRVNTLGILEANTRILDDLIQSVDRGEGAAPRTSAPAGAR